ncbi:hypothetical protein FJT64_019878 [Amphibalanus amphitrite]|uniref:Uncharacterized protein n=1 Tax=Amphibalanus amphitrite TaxID=1232801 RepID=A0A6A4X3G5_AMPAM|nr:hypothetical protein FJT64_019878 [Amphibalanus amphitrite]
MMAGPARPDPPGGPRRIAPPPPGTGSARGTGRPAPPAPRAAPGIAPRPPTSDSSRSRLDMLSILRLPESRPHFTYTRPRRLNTVLAEPGAPPAPASVVPPDHAVTQDNLVKLLHMQQQHQQQHQLEQQQQQQQMAAAQNLEQLLTMRRPPSPAAAPIEQLMAIPEARSILIGLQTGRLSRHSLVQQLHSQTTSTISCQPNKPQK